MGLEFSAYIIGAIITIFYTLKGSCINSRIHNLFLFLFLCVLSFIILQNPHSDMPTYFGGMQQDFSEIWSSTYYRKNILFWGMSSLFCRLGLEPYIVVFFWHILSFLALIQARKNFNLPYYIIPLFLCSFIGVFGLQNILRQYLVSTFLLYAFSIVSRHRFVTISIFLFCVLIHTSSLVLCGLLFLSFRKEAIHWGLFICLIACLFILAPFVFVTDYQINTLENFNVAYLVVMAMLFLFSVFSFFYLPSKSYDKRNFQIAIYLFSLSVVAFLEMGISLFYERMILLLLPFFLYLVVYYIGRFRYALILRFIFSITLLIPTFTFYAPLLMLRNDPSLF